MTLNDLFLTFSDSKTIDLRIPSYLFKFLGFPRRSLPPPRGREMPRISSSIGDHPKNHAVREMANKNALFRRLLPYVKIFEIFDYHMFSRNRGFEFLFFFRVNI